jgi:hypothetical protein
MCLVKYSGVERIDNIVKYALRLPRYSIYLCAYRCVKYLLLLNIIYYFTN